ncbi:MAG: glycosyltransferase [bacterium]|nr:glycosyltransferase [bacterium]
MLEFSIIIPTLNSERTLDQCLKYLFSQNYDQSRYQVIVSDGGSIDHTFEIAKKYKTQIINNPLQTGEAGKMAGLKIATGELIVFLDSDNILIDPDWLFKMRTPFSDLQISASEPIRYDYRLTDHHLTRYFSYIGMGDPLNLFLGNYDRYSQITGRWTGLDLEQAQMENYIKVHLFPSNMPTIGANGFVLRRNLLDSLKDKEYLFDVDILNQLQIASNQNNTPSCYVAKVDTGVVHLFSGNLSAFVRKQKRRAKDYLYYNSINLRYSHNSSNKLTSALYPGGPSTFGLIIFILSCLTVIPLLVQAMIGFIKKPDWVWLLHPVVCELTLFIYASERIKSIFHNSIYDRSKWSQ